MLVFPCKGKWILGSMVYQNAKNVAQRSITMKTVAEVGILVIIVLDLVPLGL